MSQTGLKLAALILMFGDHVGQFIPGAPFILRIAGRISAPLFLFCAREGFGHTKNRKAYLARLYIFSLIMGCINRRLAVLIPNPYRPCTNNIFSSFLYCLFLSSSQTGGRQEKAKTPFICCSQPPISLPLSLFQQNTASSALLYAPPCPPYSPRKEIYWCLPWAWCCGIGAVTGKSFTADILFCAQSTCL